MEPSRPREGEDVFVRANGAVVPKVHHLVGWDLEVFGIPVAGSDVVQLSESNALWVRP